MKNRYSIRSLLLAVLFVAAGLAWWLDSMRLNTKLTQLESQVAQLDTLNRALATETDRYLKFNDDWKNYLALAESTSLENALSAQQQEYGNRVRTSAFNSQIAQVFDRSKSMTALFDKQQDILDVEIQTCKQLLAAYKGKANTTPQQLLQLKKKISFYESLAIEAKNNKALVKKQESNLSL